MNDMATTRMLLTTAVLAAVAAFITAPAQAYFVDGGGGGSSSAAAAPTPTRTGLDPAIQTAMQAQAAEERSISTSSQPAPIPYLSHGIGLSGDVDESRFAGDVAADTSLSVQPTRGVDESRFAGDVARASASTPTQTSLESGFDWTWVGLGAGMSALLAAGMTALYLATRQRGRVALP